MANQKLTDARKAQNDEFYTQYHDIEREVNAYLEFDPEVFKNKTILLPCDDPEWSNFTKYFAQNFKRLGLKKLISTSYAHESKTYKDYYQPTLFETSQAQYDKNKTTKHGKIYTLSQDENGDKIINVDDLKWNYLEGDGDFRSREVTKLRDEADIIVTNPPFSLLSEFISWIIEGEKLFLIIGNMNAITYKEIFPHIKATRIWLGVTHFNTGMYFYVPENFIYTETYKFERYQNSKKVNRVAGVCWFTNLDHGRRHVALPLMTMADNLKFSKNKNLKGKSSYDKYDNYDAIEVPTVSAIPSNYEGVMGVPIGFLDKFSPEQFEIIGATESEGKGFSNGLWDETSNVSQPLVNNKRLYKRIFIRHKRSQKS